MKNCDEIAPLLSAFVDGELTDEERAAVRAHVSECEKCGALLGELTALHAAFGEMRDEDVPLGFTEGVMAAVRAEKAERPQTKKRSVRRWMPVAACAAVVVLAAAVAIPHLNVQSASDAAMPASEVQSYSMDTAAATDTASADAEEEYPEQFWEAVQFAAPDEAADGNGRAKTLTTDAPSANEAAETEYCCETVRIGLYNEAGEEGELFAASYGPVVLDLYGAGSEDYVLSSGGVKADDTCGYYVPIDALRDLPEGLSMSSAQAETLSHAPAEAEWVLVYPDENSEVPQP